MPSLYLSYPESYKQFNQKKVLLFFIVVILVGALFPVYPKDIRADARVYKVERNNDSVKLFYTYLINGVRYKGIYSVLGEYMSISDDSILVSHFSAVLKQGKKENLVLEKNVSDKVLE